VVVAARVFTRATISTVLSRVIVIATAVPLLAHELARVLVLVRLVNHSLIDPNLDADLSKGSEGLGEAVVDVGAKGMKWDTAVFMLFSAGHIRSAKASRDPDLASQRPALDRVNNGHLDRFAEGSAVLELPSDVLRDYLSVGIGLLDLFYLDLDFLARDLLYLGANALDIRSLNANENARASGMDHDRHPLRMADDLDFCYVRPLALGQLDYPAAYTEILVKRLRVISRIDVPARFPILVYS
jgi:hypothetical protein